MDTGCEYCDETEDLIEVDGITLCNHCLHDLYTQCNDCEEWVSNNSCTYLSAYDINVCNHCLHDLYTQCNDCEEWIRDDELHSRAGHNVCEECAETYWYCSSCDEYFRDGHECDCIDDKEDDDNHIHNHDFKPDPIFHSSEIPIKSNIYYGLELETDDYTDRVQAGELLFDNSCCEKEYYLKEDSSLDDGIEIVFHPRLLSSWLDYTDYLARIKKNVLRGGGMPGNPKNAESIYTDPDQICQIFRSPN